MLLDEVFVLVVAAAAAVNAKTLSPKDDNLEPFMLDEFLSGTFSTRTFNGSWLTGDSFLFRDTAADYKIYNVKTQETTSFLERTVLTGYTGASITISADQKFVLIRYNVNSVFRHSTTASFAIYNIETKEYHDVANKEPCQIAVWTPIDHALVYIYKNNIYYIDSPGAAPKSITTSGVEGEIYNGVPDWVYEEEVLGSGSAFWFSPSGKKIAFASFNDTEVLDFKYFTYGDVADLETLSNQYPTEVDIRYPKVGTANPVVHTYIADLETGNAPFEIDAIPAEFLPDDYVLYDMSWVSEEEVVVISTNRVQNEGRVVRCNIDGTPCALETAYKEENGWLNPEIPIYDNDGTRRIEILPRSVDNDFFYHLVLTNITSGAVRNLTSGRYVVTNIYGWDEDNNIVYFLGSFEDDPTQRQVYAVNTETAEHTCLTCSMGSNSEQCLYAAASLSKDYSYISKVCQGPEPHYVEIQSTESAINLDNSNILVWEDNQAVMTRLALKARPKIKNLKVPTADGKYSANVRLFLPPNLDENNVDQKYPAVVYVYAGPNSNQINNAYSSGFQNYIVTNRQYIYIYIDGRGSGRDGQNKMFEIYKKFATVEVEDQIAVTKYLQENFPYIDAERTGIWGWSYGGFASVWALVKDTGNVFRFGVSVAPVTNFILYDTIYTERYMGLLSENIEGYNNTDVTINVEALRGKLYFLIHGNADDNVHYQQAMILSRALELADIDFRQQSYPDENHSLGGVSRHLYHTLDQYWARSFGLPVPLRSASHEVEHMNQKEVD